MARLKARFRMNPTLDELGRELGRSRTGTLNMLRRLEVAGLVTHERDRTRSWRAVSTAVEVRPREGAELEGLLGKRIAFIECRDTPHVAEGDPPE